ncbi:hypothetical protein CLOM_g14353 [Closterium sp. NIES-68]|nr:hypothetical protein CLOM_g14353 [Closterium sp. NIES-68]
MGSRRRDVRSCSRWSVLPRQRAQTPLLLLVAAVTAVAATAGLPCDASRAVAPRLVLEGGCARYNVAAWSPLASAAPHTSLPSARRLLQVTAASPPDPPGSGLLSRPLLISLIAACAAVILVIATLWFCMCCRQARRAENNFDEAFLADYLAKCTSHYDPQLKLGSGPFGDSFPCSGPDGEPWLVVRATLPGGVAGATWLPWTGAAAKTRAFNEEIVRVSRLSHPHLLHLIGWSEQPLRRADGSGRRRQPGESMRQWAQILWRKSTGQDTQGEGNGEKEVADGGGELGKAGKGGERGGEGRKGRVRRTQCAPEPDAERSAGLGRELGAECRGGREAASTSASVGAGVAGGRQEGQRENVAGGETKGADTGAAGGGVGGGGEQGVRGGGLEGARRGGGGRELVLLYEWSNEKTLLSRLQAQRELRKHGNDSDAASSPQPLAFSQRLDIATAIAEALCHLHTAAHPPLVHGRLCSSSVFLEVLPVARLANLGIVKGLPGAPCVGQQCHVAAPHRDPDWWEHMWPTTRTDIYGLGVIMLELLSGHPAMATHHGTGSTVYMDTKSILDSIAADDLAPILDPSITAHSMPLRPVRSFARLAARCASPATRCRPDIASVVSELQGISRAMIRLSMARTTANSSFVSRAGSLAESCAADSPDGSPRDSPRNTPGESPEGLSEVSHAGLPDSKK